MQPPRDLDRCRRHGRPGEKAELVKNAEKEVVAVESQYQDGAITHGERYNKIIEIWSRVTEKVSDEMFSAMEEDDRTGRYLNPIYIMADSGARGSKQQIRQLSGNARFDGQAVRRDLETPITATSAKASTCCSTSSRRTARVRVWRIRR